MSKFRKSRLASAMLCTLLFGGNVGAMKKDMSKTISKNDLSTKDKELENRKPDDSGNKFLKYALYFLGLGKLVDEGVGFAEAKGYIENKKLSPLGKLSLCKLAMAKYYKTKTIGTMRSLVAESYKNAEGIKQVFDSITEFLTEYPPQGAKKVEGKDNVFDVACSGEGVDIKKIFRYIYKEADLVFVHLSDYLKAVLGVSVEQCDKILVNLNQNNKYIAFVKDNVCLKLTKDEEKIRFMLCTVGNNSPEIWEDYSLRLDSCYSVTQRYMGHILGIKNIESLYSFYGLTFAQLYSEFLRCKNKADKVFPDLFKEEKLIELK